MWNWCVHQKPGNLSASHYASLSQLTPGQKFRTTKFQLAPVWLRTLLTWVLSACNEQNSFQRLEGLTTLIDSRRADTRSLLSHAWAISLFSSRNLVTYSCCDIILVSSRASFSGSSSSSKCAAITDFFWPTAIVYSEKNRTSTRVIHSWLRGTNPHSLGSLGSWQIKHCNNRNSPQHKLHEPNRFRVLDCKQFKSINLEQPYFFQKLQVQKYRRNWTTFWLLGDDIECLQNKNQTRSYERSCSKLYTLSNCKPVACAKMAGVENTRRRRSAYSQIQSWDVFYDQLMTALGKYKWTIFLPQETPVEHATCNTRKCIIKQYATLMAASTVDREEERTTYLANGFRNHGNGITLNRMGQTDHGWLRYFTKQKTKEWDNLCVISLVNNQEPNMHNNYSWPAII